MLDVGVIKCLEIGFLDLDYPSETFIRLECSLPTSFVALNLPDSPLEYLRSKRLSMLLISQNTI